MVVRAVVLPRCAVGTKRRFANATSTSLSTPIFVIAMTAEHGGNLVSGKHMSYRNQRRVCHFQITFPGNQDNESL